jgi:hypothetical protein
VTDPTERAPHPILFLDVDGVISVFGFSPGAERLPGPLHWIDGVAHCIPEEVGPRLVRLAQRFELVWATGWEQRANELPLLLRLPEAELPVLLFHGRAVFGSSDWKLEAIDAYAGERPAAWIDDNIDEACREWAKARAAPTLLVEARSDVGISDRHVEELLAFADRVAPRSAGDGASGPAGPRPPS